MTDPKTNKTEDAAETVNETTAVPADTDTKDAEGSTKPQADADESTEPDADGADETAEADSEEKAEKAAEKADAGKSRRRPNWARVFALGVLPALALLLAGAAGFLKWQDSTARVADTARIEAIQVAKDSTVALLSYQPETVEQQLGAARDLLTGEFKDSYTSLTNDVVIPGAKQKQISAVASVPAAASVSVDADHAVVLLFVNQTVVVGADPPTDTASSVRVTLDEVDGRWLISSFEPV